MSDKFCKDCKHVWQASYSVAQCLHGAEPDPVSGEPEGVSCRVARSSVGTCGPEGRLFEERPPYVQTFHKPMSFWPWRRK